MGLKVLPTLVGLSLWDCLALAFCTLIISHFRWLVKHFFAKSYIFPRRYLARTSSKKMVREPVAYSSHFTRVRPLKRRNIFFVPLLYHNLGDLSRGFPNFFSPFHEGATGEDTRLGFPSPLDTNSIPHLSLDYNRQNVQNWDFYFPKLCATFRLTNCWRCVIMEICAPHTRGRADENALWWIKKPTAFVSRSQKRWGNSIQLLAISGATPTSIS